VDDERNNDGLTTFGGAIMHARWRGNGPPTEMPHKACKVNNFHPQFRICRLI